MINCILVLLIYLKTLVLMGLNGFNGTVVWIGSSSLMAAEEGKKRVFILKYLKLCCEETKTCGMSMSCFLKVWTLL